MEAQAVTFASSPFAPLAIGFFGLGTGYFIWGGQALVWISQDQSGSQPDPGVMGLLDAGVHAVPYRHLSFDRTNVV